MKISPLIIPIMKRWELCMLKSYKDKDGSWHIGYGHGNASGVPPFVDETTTLKDEKEAEDILFADLEYLLSIVKKQIKSEVILNDNQFSAIMDVAYNRGPGTLRESAVMYWINNPEDGLHLKKAARAFVFHEDGFKTLDTAFDPKTQETRVYLGLQLRRIDDASLFQTPIKD